MPQFDDFPQKNKYRQLKKIDWKVKKNKKNRKTCQILMVCLR